MNICSISGCGKMVVAKNYCRKHYTRLYNHGSPHFVRRWYIKGVPYDRIIEKIVVDEKTGCWNYSGALNKTGYGLLTINGKRVRVHRFMYEYYKGKIAKGKFACHSCDNPRCCNPKHLWVGTQKDNMLDAKNKGRNIFGEKSENHKITQKDAEVIRKFYNMGQYTQIALARRFKISQVTVNKIIHNKIWNNRRLGHIHE